MEWNILEVVREDISKEIIFNIRRDTAGHVNSMKSILSHGPGYSGKERLCRYLKHKAKVDEKGHEREVSTEQILERIINYR